MSSFREPVNVKEFRHLLLKLGTKNIEMSTIPPDYMLNCSYNPLKDMPDIDYCDHSLKYNDEEFFAVASIYYGQGNYSSIYASANDRVLFCNHGDIPLTMTKMSTIPACKLLWFGESTIPSIPAV